ncbi:54S ribosomal protein L37, mitochondrial [Psilocybe cubensis]|uniref:54S ribosomal protein L37, mitochondrial n=2 Tax=Psilocybe cubensis TaxID=181762 RepID=A0ACB8H935_PSICU|nr:54S ribosomal protein L37, mitochondrial [Psilocybe cubensis]KAH9484518.1 54S ribosomal protein L37, mitochondrial [Psilocybe cubensis]
MSFLQSIRRTCSKRTSWVWARSYSAANVTPPSSEGSKNPAASSTTSQSAPLSISSCAPDTVLKGVNYLKGQAPVVARPDEEYPPWLWNVLKPRVYEDDGPGGRKERMERRKANRQAIKDRNFMQTQ